MRIGDCEDTVIFDVKDSFISEASGDLTRPSCNMISILFFLKKGL